MTTNLQTTTLNWEDKFGLSQKVIQPYVFLVICEHITVTIAHKILAVSRSKAKQLSDKTKCCGLVSILKDGSLNSKGNFVQDTQVIMQTNRCVTGPKVTLINCAQNLEYWCASDNTVTYGYVCSLMRHTYHIHKICVNFVFAKHCQLSSKCYQ